MVSAIFIGLLGTSVHSAGSMTGVTLSAHTQSSIVRGTGLDRDGALQVRSTGTASQSVLVRFDWTPKPETRRLVLPVLNRSTAAINGTLFLTGTTGSGNVGFSVEPGWNALVVDRLNSGATLDWATLRRAEFLMNSPQSQTAMDTANGLYPLTFDAVSVNPRGTPVITVSWDDGFKTVLNHAWPVIQQFPRIRHTLNVVKDWVQNGSRTGIDASPTMSASDIQFLFSTGQFKIANHSDRHFRYETGINPNYVGTTSRIQVVGVRSGTGKFRLNLGGTLTPEINHNNSQRSLEAELAKIVGTGNVKVYAGGSAYIQNSYGLRVEFTTPQPIMTAAVTQGNVIPYVGAGFTEAEIATAYQVNRDFLIQSGWVTSDVDTVAYPEGSVGPTVLRAMRSISARYGRAMARRNGNGFFLHPIFRLEPYQVPAINVSAVGVTETLNAIDACIAVGGHLNLMLHDVSPSQASSGNVINTGDLWTILNYLNTKIDSGLRIMTQGEYADTCKFLGIRTGTSTQLHPVGRL